MEVTNTQNTQLNIQLLGVPDAAQNRVRTRNNSITSNASSARSNGTGTLKRKKLDTSLGDADLDDLFAMELQAQVEVETIAGDVRNYLEQKQSKSHKVSNDVIAYVGDKILVAVEAVRRLALLNAELKGQVRILKDERWNQPQDDNAPTYSSIVRGQRKDKIPPIMARGKKVQPKNRFELLVQASDQDDNSTPEEIKVKLLSTLDPVTDGIQLKNIRRTKKGVILETAEREHMDKLMRNAELVNEGLTATEVKKRNPRVIIYDVPADMEEARIKEALYNQNNLEGTKKEELGEHLALKFRRGKRDEPTTNWVLEVTPKMRNILRNLDRVYIGLRRCRVMDFSAITRCYKCQGLGHVAKHCRATKESCGHCGEEGHKMEACKKKEAPRACALCKRIGKPSDHPANNDCPTYNNTVEAWQQNTNYG